MPRRVRIAVLAYDRYIELDPVRANVVAHSADDPPSSLRANAQRANNALLIPHTEHLALSGRPAGRRRA